MADVTGTTFGELFALPRGEFHALREAILERNRREAREVDAAKRNAPRGGL